MATLALLATVLCGPSVVEDGPADDPDWVTPYLGLSALDGEDLKLDADAAPVRHVSSTRRTSPLPFWARLLPDLTLALQYRTARNLVLAAATTNGSQNGFIFMLWATFPLPEEPTPREVLLAAPTARAALHPVSATEWPEPVPENPDTAAEASAGPTVQQLQLAAEHASATPRSDLAGWGARARASAFLPELTLEYRRNVGEVDTLGIRSDLGIDSHNIEDITRYGARATWQLGQIVFNREELSAAQTAEGIERARRELLLEVTRLFFHRQALRQELHAQPPPEPARRSQVSLEIAQTEAELDALTGGYLSRELTRGSR